MAQKRNYNVPCTEMHSNEGHFELSGHCFRPSAFAPFISETAVIKTAGQRFQGFSGIVVNANMSLYTPTPFLNDIRAYRENVFHCDTQPNT